MQWFDVDRKGLAKLLERRGKEFVLFELIQNAWDADSTEVHVSLQRIAGTRSVRLKVTDDNPDGFADLSHAFVLFAESASVKRADATKRGRFALGEKLVLALCDEAEIASTRGTVVFDCNGRHLSRKKTARGSVFTGVLRMTTDELDRCGRAVQTLIPPAHVRTFYNGEQLATRSALAFAEATLPTEVANAEGYLKSTQRRTIVAIHEPLPGETPTLYEMGIPVCETLDRWHLDVGQKVPLNMDRDNVSPAYLSRVRALAVERMHDALSVEDANAPWVREAIQRHGGDLSDDTILKVAHLRFGEKAVIHDPSDPEANHLAVARGYTVVHGGQMSRAEWEAVRRAGALLPAGQVTPSPKPYSEDGEVQRELQESKWTEGMRQVVAYIHRIAPVLLDRDVAVCIVSDVGWPHAATFGPGGVLTLNLGRLGHRWFDGPLEAINALLLHEFGHNTVAGLNHLSSDYHDALTMLGARLVRLALENPTAFELRPACVAH